MAFNLTLGDVRVAIIGLGYVGLPLAVAFGRIIPTLGYDICRTRIDELNCGLDASGEVESNNLLAATQLRFSDNLESLRTCNVFIIAVPTPIDSSHRPDLTHLITASRTVAAVIKPGDVVIYESTVYPGATEEDCLPVVEKLSGLVFNRDFYAGYSPERINPGDKDRPLAKIVKVTSGSTPEVADFVDALYASIITAGTYKASSIRVAEASKVIENTQRDVNIALINELSIIFSHLGLDTNEVIDAAATKWNFVRLRPGLVGGHCISVDPYYLLHKSVAMGYIPDIIRTAREINDGMARNTVIRLVKEMISRDLPVKGARVLVSGVAFKENCRDTRNTRIVEMVENLRSYGMNVEVVDTWASPEVIQAEHGLSIGTALPAKGAFDVVILAVAHTDIVSQGAGVFRRIMQPKGVLFDMKAAFAIGESELRL